MKVGQNIKLRAYNGEELARMVVDLKKDMVYVCTQSEYERARLAKREPICVGFNLRYVIDQGVGGGTE